MRITWRGEMLLVGLLLLLQPSASLRANVYATNIKLNGSLNAAVLLPGGGVTISYILNEPATAGLAVQIFSGTNVIKTFSVASGLAGSFAGRNSFKWDGIQDNGSAVRPGVYTVNITAAAEGYQTWTAISDDSTNFYVFFPTCITVNQNTNSPYYGRVFVGNASTDKQFPPGILKNNADGSAADEGGFGTGGYAWSGNGFVDSNPWKMGISADDMLYVEDWRTNGMLLAFDQVLSTNYLNVLGPDNWPYPGVSLSGACLSGAGTNSQVWMADITPAMEGGQGVLRWNLSADGTVAAGDTGTVIVAAGGDSDLTDAPYDVTVDASGRIYVIQQVDFASTDQNTNLDTMRVLCFPAYHPGEPQGTKALWEMGRGERPTLETANGLAVNPTATFVAIASEGEGAEGDFEGGGISILDANSGLLVTNITADPSGTTNLPEVVFDVAWDNVGNLYAAEWTESVWRIYSPPGSNQAKTVAVPVIQALDSLTAPTLSAPTPSLRQLSFTLVGQSHVTYVIEQSPDLVTWSPLSTNYDPNPSRLITVPLAGAQAFYRAEVNQ